LFLLSQLSDLIPSLTISYGSIAGSVGELAGSLGPHDWLVTYFTLEFRYFMCWTPSLPVQLVHLLAHFVYLLIPLF